MYFSKATDAELNTILEILRDGRAQLAEAGVDQWQGDYPNVEQIKEDIKNGHAYLFNADDHATVGCVAITSAPDNVYDTMDGKWLIQTDNYLTIHRFAILSTHAGKGYATTLFKQLIAHITAEHPEIDSLRIDTHVDNKAMQHLITKMGFTHVGDLNGVYRHNDKCYVYEQVINH